MMKFFLTIITLILSCAVFAVQDTDFTMNGAVLKEKKNNTEIWEKPDGTVITIFADKTEAQLPDGSRIIKYSNGRREVFTKDGKTIVVDEAKGIREYSNGKTKQALDFTGMTPFGEKIPRVEKIIQKDPLIRMVYVPEKSDEILYPEKSEEKIEWEIKDFFDGLYDAVRQKYINDAQQKNKYSGKPFDFEISYCRYCKTGYCFGKPKRLLVEIKENDAIIKMFDFDGSLLRKKEKQQENIKEILQYLSNK
jgi:hypothetical protein